MGLAKVLPPQLTALLLILFVFLVDFVKQPLYDVQSLVYVLCFSKEITQKCSQVVGNQRIHSVKVGFYDVFHH
jgi:hypothetical protein